MKAFEEQAAGEVSRFLAKLASRNDVQDSAILCLVLRILEAKERALGESKGRSASREFQPHTDKQAPRMQTRAMENESSMKAQVDAAAAEASEMYIDPGAFGRLNKDGREKLIASIRAQKRLRAINFGHACKFELPDAWAATEVKWNSSASVRSGQECAMLLLLCFDSLTSLDLRLCAAAHMFLGDSRPSGRPLISRHSCAATMTWVRKAALSLFKPCSISKASKT